jgi:hypothetical protein
MDRPFYEFTILEDAYRYEFTSIGEKEIRKVIVYQQTDLPDFFSLTLADVLPDGSLDVFVESKNGNMEKILATVIQTILAFLFHNPEAKIAFSGSTAHRTRLYSIILTKEVEKVAHILTILGLSEKGLVPFERNEKYDGFVIFTRK